MKLSKKGVSIIELIISVALIALIMLFMYNLLSDITFEKENDSFAFLNQEQRLTIIKNVEKTINNDSSVRSITSSSTTIYFKDSSNKIVYYLAISSDGKKLVLYQGSGSSKVALEKWTMQGGTLNLFDKDNNTSCESAALTNGTIYSCTYKIYTDNTNNKDYTYKLPKSGSTVDTTITNNNIIDDITFTFIIWG